MNIRIAMSFGFLVLSLSACSSIARKVQVQPGAGGVIAIPNAEANRSKANTLMQDVCGNDKIVIVNEKEVPIASIVETDTTKLNGSTGNSNSSSLDAGEKHSRSEYSSENEWRIQFECR